MWIGIAFVVVIAALMAGWVMLAVTDPEALFREEGRR
jgi:hypothetical protein